MAWSRVSEPERAQMRALRKQGLSVNAISRVVGRSHYGTKPHVQGIVPHREPDPGAVARLRRLDRWYASINRTMAEVRA